MAKHWTDKYSFITGTVRRSQLGYLVLSDDAINQTDIPHSHFIEWDAGSWGDGGQKRWTVISISVCLHPLEQMVAIGPYGEAMFIGKGDVHEERIGEPGKGPREIGPLRCVRGIGQRAYAVGMMRQVYRRDDANVWVPLGENIRPAQGEIVGFEAIDGFSEDDIYAVGWEGEIWHFDGREWARKDSPTNFTLVDVCCASDDKVYACGRMGLLLRGRNDEWEIIAHESMSEDIWSLAWYDGKLYLSTMRAVFTLENDHLKVVDMGADSPTTCYRLSARDGVLWSIGSKDVMAFDGATWTRID